MINVYLSLIYIYTYLFVLEGDRVWEICKVRIHKNMSVVMYTWWYIYTYICIYMYMLCLFVFEGDGVWEISYINTYVIMFVYIRIWM
jgi:hypothetical protein